MRSSKEMSGCPTSVARTYHRDETWDCLRVRTYGNRALEVLVSVTPHQGRREGRLQGEAAQGYALARGRARDVRMLNWSKSDSGEPRDAETVLRGSHSWKMRKKLPYYRVLQLAQESLHSTTCAECCMSIPAFLRARGAGDAALDRGG